MSEPREERKDGFYWIRLGSSEGPEPALWAEEEWIVLGSETTVADEEVQVIAGPIAPPIRSDAG